MAPEPRPAGREPGLICVTVAAAYYGLEPSSLARRHHPHIARAVAAWFCRRHTEAHPRDLAGRFGLSRADCVPNLTRRLEAKLPESPALAEELGQILESLAGGVVPARDHDQTRSPGRTPPQGRRSGRPA